MLLNILQNIVDEKRRLQVSDSVIKNYLKEYLQYPVLDFIYNGQEYNDFIFVGGSCLRICFDGPRLSEDLDFDLPEVSWKKFDLKAFAEKIAVIFRTKYLLPVEVKTQSDYRVYLKFPILKQLGLAGKAESDLLFVKVEPNQSRFPADAVERTPIAKYGYNFMARNYKLPFLMVGKIGALFERLWFKGKENEIDIKGRDFFDFFWYLQNKVEPDWNTLNKTIGIADKEDLKKKIIVLIDEKVTVQKLSFDLSNFFPDQMFVETFCKNYKELIMKYL
ncbi:MAG: nucleotidyl transferase AbiEii/AbiGii toxin family protein [Patescibacteria group bacterium]